MKTLDIYLYSGTVEVHRTPRVGWRKYRLTNASFNRIMYLSDKYGVFVTPHCFRIEGQEKSPGKQWGLYIAIQNVQENN